MLLSHETPSLGLLSLLTDIVMWDSEEDKPTDDFSWNESAARIQTLKRVNTVKNHQRYFNILLSYFTVQIQCFYFIMY